MPNRTTKKTSTEMVDSAQSYFQRLSFDPKLAQGFVAKYISNIRIVMLLIITLILLGVMSYYSLPKRLNPEVKIPIVTVATFLPGAGPQDVESLVTIPLEDKVRNLKGVDTVTSVSRDNVSFITLQFFSSVDRDKAKDDTKSAVDSVTDLPANAQSPNVTALDFEDQPVWTFSITTENDVPALMRFSDELKRKIDDLPKVDRVITSGYDTQEVVVQVDPEKVQQLGINPLTLAQNIKRGVASYPAGTITTDRYSFALTIDPSITKLQDIRDMRVTIQGKTFALGDVATVVEKSKPDQAITFLTNKETTPRRAVTFYVYKTSSTNIDEAAKSVKDTVDQVLNEQHGKFKLTTLVNTSNEITKQFSDLLHEFQSTIILVFICLFLFLGLRQAIIASLTVPLTFFSAFFFMQFFGMSINFLSLFAFLLALGLLVDDTIVVVQAMTTYYKTGKFTPLQTGLLVWRDTIVPIWSTTITTIWSFVPLLISTGIIGEFIKPIPIVVTITMISSTAIAVLITLPLMIVILKPSFPGRVVLLGRIVGLLFAFLALFFFAGGNPLMALVGVVYLAFLFVGYRTVPGMIKNIRKFLGTKPFWKRAQGLFSRYSNHGVISIEPLANAYHRLIIRILSSKSAQRKVLFAIIAYAIISFALLPLGFVKNEFFPKSDEDQVYVSLELPNGTPISQTTQEGLALLEQLRQTPETEFVTAEVGRNSNQNNGLTDSGQAVFFTLHLKPKEIRAISSLTIAENLRKQFTGYNKGTLLVVEASGGPPVGSDLQIKLLGDDLGKLNDYADQIVEYLKQQPGATNVQKSISSGTSKLTFIPDLNKINDAGLSVDTVGNWMRMYASGFPMDSINFDKSTTTKTDIVFRLGQADGTTKGVGQIAIFTPAGQAVPLLSLGKLETQVNPTQITREDGKRTISVSAAVKQGYVTTVENKKMEDFANSIHLPAGYSWKTGGANEENNKSVQSIMQAMVLSAILILITMVVQFQSFRQAIIVLVVIPLAVSSVFLAFALTGTPLSFPALIGVLSLFGIVVTNSMFIVDKINLNQKLGMGLKESIADAGSSRLEPIILTKLCTVLGLLPITLADPLWRGLGGAIISGLLVSSTIMLLFIPVLYYSWFSPSKKASANK
jgi:multidrug efflux pump subunit AcrB